MLEKKKLLYYPKGATMEKISIVKGR